MRKQFFLKVYLSWNPQYPKRKTEDTSGTCAFCGERANRTASLYTEYGKLLFEDICKNCAENLPAPKIKNLKEFYSFLAVYPEGE